MSNKIEYARPSLCRLCKSPVGEFSVPMASLDIVKLGRWWKQTLRVEFDDSLDTVASNSICQFCLCDACFQEEHHQNNDGIDSSALWFTAETNIFFEKFYTEAEKLRPCQVKIVPVKIPKSMDDKFNICNEPENGNTLDLSIRTRSPSTCAFCGRVFGNLVKVFTHVKTDHQNLKTFPCPRCMRIFRSNADRHAHCEQFDHFYKTRICCHYCSKTANKSRLGDHILQAHVEHKYSCCGQLNLNLEELCNHMEAVRHNRLPCVYCNKLFHTKNMSLHIKRCHASEVIKCPYKRCRRYFNKLEDKQKHMMEVHESKPGVKPCPYCPSKLISGNLQRHISIMHTTQAITCNFNNRCKAQFLSEEERKEHIDQFHYASKVLPFSKCLYCGLNVPISQMNWHVRSKHKKDVKRCRVFHCNQFFLSKEELSNHAKANHPAKQFRCKVCDFCFVSFRNLKLHVLTMHGTESVQCNQCPKYFKSQLALINHCRRTHSAPKHCIHCSSSCRRLAEHLWVTPCYKCNELQPCRKLRMIHVKTCIKRK